MRSFPLIAAGMAAATLAACASDEPQAVSQTERDAAVALALQAGAPASNSEAGRRSALIGAGVNALTRTAIDNYMDRQQTDLTRELTGSGVAVVRDGDNLVLSMPGDATFDFDAADIHPGFYPVLDQVADVLNRYPQTVVDVAGHADAEGPEAYNQALSEKRAASVAVYLIDRDRVLPVRLFVVGRGESQPIASNDTPEGRALNRRVDILIRPFTDEATG